MNDLETLNTLEKFIRAEIDRLSVIPNPNAIVTAAKSSALLSVLRKINELYKDGLIEWMNQENAKNATPSPSPKDYETLTFGSADDNMVVRSNLATHHAQVRFYRNGSVQVIDLGTADGTYVDFADKLQRVQGPSDFFISSQLAFLGDDYRYSYGELITALLNHLNRDSLWG